MQLLSYCRTFSLAFSASLAFSSITHGQEIEEIVVTATKQEQIAHNLGIGVSVIGASSLELLDGAEDIVERVSGLQAAIANGNQISFQMRGIGAVDHQALTPTAAGVYVDGIYQATNVQTSPLLFDLKRVEILKGPQGTLYGRNTTGGAISFISREPENNNEGYVQFGLGNKSQLTFSGATNRIVHKDITVRIAGRYLKGGPYHKNTQTNSTIAQGPKKAGGVRDEFALKFHTRVSPTAQTELLFKAHYAEDNGVNPTPRNNSLSVDPHEISTEGDGVQHTDNEFYGISAKVIHRTQALTLTSLTAYEGYNQDYGFDFDGTPAPFGLKRLNANLSYDRGFSQLSHESHVQHQSEYIKSLLGIYLETQNFNQSYLIWCGTLNLQSLLGTCPYVGASGRVGPNPHSSTRALSLVSTISQKLSTAALFSHNQISLAHNLEAVAGVRLTHESIRGQGEGVHYFEDGSIGLNNVGGLGLAIGENEISTNKLSGTLGINYHPSHHTMFYLNYANGFKSGGFNGEVINNAAHFSDEGLFGSEHVDALEGGVKIKGRKLALEASIYHYWYENPQARIFVNFPIPDGGSFTSNSLSNLDAARSYGMDVTARWKLNSNLLFSGGLTLLDTEINQNKNPHVPQNAEAFDGNPLPFASNVSLALSMQYSKAISHALTGSVEVNGKYQSAFYLDAEGLRERRQNAYELINASTTIKHQDGYSLSLWMRNITNSDHATSGFGFIGYNTFRSNPRSYGLRFGATF